jgi:hypothetical protein
MFSIYVFSIDDTEEGPVGADLGCGGGKTSCMYTYIHICIHIYRSLIRKAPWVLTLDVEEEILPALQTLQDLGVYELAKVLCMYVVCMCVCVCVCVCVCIYMCVCYVCIIYVYAYIILHYICTLYYVYI